MNKVPKHTSHRRSLTPIKRRFKDHSRLGKINLRIGQVLHFQRIQMGLIHSEVIPAVYPTYTQARKALKQLPRHIREEYENNLRSSERTQREKIKARRLTSSTFESMAQRIIVRKQKKIPQQDSPSSGEDNAGSN